jgi:hypothetical protein
MSDTVEKCIFVVWGISKMEEVNQNKTRAFYRTFIELFLLSNFLAEVFLLETKNDDDEDDCAGFAETYCCC